MLVDAIAYGNVDTEMAIRCGNNNNDLPDVIIIMIYFCLCLQGVAHVGTSTFC